jgi:hypothetical protein
MIIIMRGSHRIDPSIQSDDSPAPSPQQDPMSGCGLFFLFYAGPTKAKIAVTNRSPKPKRLNLQNPSEAFEKNGSRPDTKRNPPHNRYRDRTKGCIDNRCIG